MAIKTGRVIRGAGIIPYRRNRHRRPQRFRMDPTRWMAVPSRMSISTAPGMNSNWSRTAASTATMKNAVAYLRVSTADQATEGVSLDAQEAKIKAWCLLNDFTLQGVFVDAGISGKSADNRPELQAALTACSKGGALVVYSLSRLARSTQDTLAIADRLQKKDVDLVSLSEKIDTTSASGKMVFRMMAVLSEFERDQVAERTTVAMAHKKSLGERVGQVPFGFVVAADGVQLLANETEQEIIRVVVELRKDGLTMRAIADRLTVLGYKPRGVAWYASTISNILKAA